MSDLDKIRCEPCRLDTPLATANEIVLHMQQLPHWEIIEIDSIKRLSRTFSFKDFRTALAFTNKVGTMADMEGHHPALLTEWGKVTVSWWSHKIKGLHKNDFIMAAKTDALA